MYTNFSRPAGVLSLFKYSYSVTAALSADSVAFCAIIMSMVGSFVLSLGEGVRVDRAMFMLFALLA